MVWDGPHAPQGEFDPAWSPDGRSIAFIRSPETPARRYRLYVLRPGASEPISPSSLNLPSAEVCGSQPGPQWDPHRLYDRVPPPGQNYEGLGLGCASSI